MQAPAQSTGAIEASTSRPRNQVLRGKFFAMKDEIRNMAPHIVDLFDNAHKEASGKRDTQTEVINNCFKKAGGKWKLDLANPYFQESKMRY